jgi:sulfate adenylyltransferase
MLHEGSFYPVKTFHNETDYKTVVSDSRLADGKVWPIPIVLDLKSASETDPSRVLTSENKEVGVGDTITLADIYGTIYATMHIDGVYTPDKKMEAMLVYGTESMYHPGVKYLFKKVKDRYVHGKIKFIRSVEWHDFKHLRHTRKELVAEFKKSNRPVIAFQTRNPIHKAHAALIEISAKKIGARILIQPVVGPTKGDDIDYRVRVKTYEAVMKQFKGATLSLLPLAMRMAGPREAVWHAIIRKNYGATHFIVGRDHAGPGNDKDGKPFYDPYEAQEKAQLFASEIGINIVPSQEIVYVDKLKKHIPIDEVPKNAKHIQLSGSAVRKILSSGEDLPEWFTFDEVKKILKESISRRRGLVILFTGISGVGKTTLAKHITHYIDYNLGRHATMLDGDEVRSWLSEGLGFSETDRKKNVLRVGKVALEIAKHGGVAVCSLIAPYESARNEIKEIVEPYADYVEIYLYAPLGLIKKRDTKGLYAQSKKDKSIKMSGAGDTYEIPKSPHLSIDTSKNNIKQSVVKVVKYVLSTLRNQ